MPQKNNWDKNKAYYVYFFCKKFIHSISTFKICTQSINWGFAKSKIFAVFFDCNVSSIDWTIPIGIFGGNNVLAGDDYPNLVIYSKDADIKVGDFVSSSPASTLLPPNIPIGIVQSVEEPSQAKKMAKILLLAKPHVIDWVQILKVKLNE